MPTDKDHAVHQLKRKLEAAFAHTKYPGDDQLAHYFGGGDCDEKRIRDAFLGRGWRQLDKSQIWVARCSICFFTVVAFRYYLPGFLLWILDRREHYEELVSSLLFVLTPRPSKKHQVSRFASERVSGYTPRQREAVAEFFRVYQEFYADEWDYEKMEETVRFWNSEELNR